MAAEESSLCKISTDLGSYYLLTKLHNGGRDGLEMTICNGENIWRGKVSPEEISSMAEAIDTELESYTQQMVKAFTGKRTDTENFVYQTTIENNKLKFYWKKQLADGVKFQLGCVDFSTVDTPRPMNMILDFAVSEMTTLKREIVQKTEDNGRLANERRKAVKLLDECVKGKAELESDLYQKFAIVLNEKKAKIRQLKSQVEDSSSGVTGHDRQEQAEETGSNKSSMCNENATTDMTDFSPSLAEKEPIKPAAKRRKRREPKPVATPKGKVVLPNVPLTKTPSTSSEDSVHTPRQRRLRSEKPSVDYDELMNDM
ncbi:DNA repair protein XRCC4 isoform X1 [Nematostella vectensis]|uniref:DNA repair protein XRCC4 isoform X1 n=1 Tax=Nematostella vectensis TaxID=45351 RepID=UPI002076E3E9|nr:DNA repair protein XRCC4 isoform X1 [Nematostella vectensis]